MTSKKDTGGKGLRNLVSSDPQSKTMWLTVGMTAVPNRANSGKTAGKSIPLSQILAPPVMEPDSGFTSVSVGVGSPSVLGGGTAWLSGFEALDGSEARPAFWGGGGWGVAGGDELDELLSRSWGAFRGWGAGMGLSMGSFPREPLCKGPANRDRTLRRFTYGSVPSGCSICPMLRFRPPRGLEFTLGILATTLKVKGS